MSSSALVPMSAAKAVESAEGYLRDVISLIEARFAAAQVAAPPVHATPGAILAAALNQQRDAISSLSQMRALLREQRQRLRKAEATAGEVLAAAQKTGQQIAMVSEYLGHCSGPLPEELDPSLAPQVATLASGVKAGVVPNPVGELQRYALAGLSALEESREVTLPKLKAVAGLAYMHSSAALCLRMSKGLRDPSESRRAFHEAQTRLDIYKQSRDAYRAQYQPRTPRARELQAEIDAA